MVSVVEVCPQGWGVVGGWLNTAAGSVRNADGEPWVPSLESVAEAMRLVQQGWDQLQP